jgi:hypothetical protein
MMYITGTTAQTIVQAKPSRRFVMSILGPLTGNTKRNARAIRILKTYIAAIDSGEIVPEPEPEPAKTPNRRPKGITKVKLGLLMTFKNKLRNKPKPVAESVPESVPESSGTLSASTFQLFREHGISQEIVKDAITYVVMHPAQHSNAMAYLHNLHKKELRF